MIDNSLEQLTIRRSQDTLRIVGAGTVLFSLWTVAKYIGLILFRKEEVMGFISGSLDGMPDLLVMSVFVVFFGVFLLIGLSFQLFVGISAFREGQGKHSYFIYIPMACIMVFSSVGVILYALKVWVLGAPESTDTLQLSDRTSFSTVIIEITSMIMMIQMIVSAHRVRKYRRKQKNAVGDGV